VEGRLEEGLEIGAEIDLNPGSPVGADTGPVLVGGTEEAAGWNPLAVMLCFTSQCVSWGYIVYCYAGYPSVYPVSCARRDGLPLNDLLVVYLPLVQWYMSR